MNRIPNVSYGLNQPLNIEAPLPIVASRAPTGNDTAEIGSIWVYPSTNQYWVLTSVVAGQGNWDLSGDTSLVFNGNSGTATPSNGAITFTGASTGLTFTGSGSTMTVALGALHATSLLTTGTITAGTGLIATTGGVTATAGGVTATAGGVTATTGNITATAGKVIAGTIVAAAGSVAGTAGQTSLTNATTAATTGVNTLVGVAGSKVNAGYLTFYVGTTPVYVPYFTTI